MKTSSVVRRRNSLYVGLWAVALTWLGVAGCFHTADPSKLKCKSQAGCPNGYVCTTTGSCQRGGGNRDGSLAVGGAAGGGTGIDANRSGGGAGGGGRDGNTDGLAGSTGNTDALSQGGAGGVGGSTGGGTSGGSGGISSPDAPGATGGTTSVPDASIAPDGVDAPAGLANGSPCTADSQCSNGLCVDGHCCDSKCDGNCESCVTGICSFTSTPRKACSGTGLCAGICDKSNVKVCTFDSTTVCAAQTCSGGVRANKSICDGLGNCPTQTKTTCDNNQCTADLSDCATCTDEPSATTCAGGHCGPTTNNCGKTVQCSTTCSGTAQTCGGGGTPNLCGCTDSSECTGHCGTLTDKCGKSVQCSTTCTGTGQTCGGGGTANVCGCAPNCTGKCGGADGCGGTCPNNCVAPQSCGGGGTANVCGCAAACSGKCGGADACGGTCPNNCVAPQSCGGGGTANVCGCTAACTDKCGGANGCGGTCPNNCVSPQSCGGGGTANVCGCTSNPSSACSGRVCGSVTDQCGNPVSCGNCPAGKSCTAGGACLCNTGTFDCGAAGCINVNGNDSSHCGSCANVCGPETTCQTGNCVCKGYAFPSSCGGCGSWGFEGGTSEGWSSTSSSTQWISTPVQSGTGALALRVLGGASSTSANVSLCTSGAAIDVSNLTMSAYVTLSTGGIGSLSALAFDANDGSGATASYPVVWGDQLNASVGQYMKYSFTFPAGTQASWVDIRLGPSPTSWAGSVYIDNVQIGP